MELDARKAAGTPHLGLPEWPHPRIAGLINELQRQVSLTDARTADEFMTSLSDVLHQSDQFLDLFGGTVWGRIAWTRDVGRPVTTRLADAFLITHQFEELRDKGIAPDGTVELDRRWKDAPRPRVWDGPHDDEHDRVSFMLYGQAPWTNGLAVDIDPAVEWEPHTAPWLDKRTRYVEYPASLQNNAGAFWPDKHGLTDLGDFHVRWWPF